MMSKRREENPPLPAPNANATVTSVPASADSVALLPLLLVGSNHDDVADELVSHSTRVLDLSERLVLGHDVAVGEEEGEGQLRARLSKDRLGELTTWRYRRR